MVRFSAWSLVDVALLWDTRRVELLAWWLWHTGRLTGVCEGLTHQACRFHLILSSALTYELPCTFLLSKV